MRIDCRMWLFDIFVHYWVIIKLIGSLLVYQAKFGLFLFNSIDGFTFLFRRSPVFHAFLSNLPKVVDYNFSLGTGLLPFFLSFLQFSTCSNSTMQFYEHISASNTLGRIDPSLRNSWLMILIVILYKVNLSSSAKLITNQLKLLVSIYELQFNYSTFDTYWYEYNSLSLSSM